MSLVPVPQIPQYRYTLFFGPELGKALPPISYCVFNVKKRSWKGGIQIVVELTHDQIARACHLLNYEAWLTNVFLSLPEEDRDALCSHARDLLVQSLCQMKLQLALQDGLRQETHCLPSESFVHELDNLLKENTIQIKADILSELDLGEDEDTAV
ncbi:MAG: hypothetical protein GKS05_05095 [Nitrospirales bacterium]|nr:hypothetical protein [Nitrospirales bacterium]